MKSHAAETELRDCQPRSSKNSAVHRPEFLSSGSRDHVVSVIHDERRGSIFTFTNRDLLQRFHPQTAEIHDAAKVVALDRERPA